MLRALMIVGRQLHIVAGYEKRNRERTTVLKRIDELLTKTPATTS